MTDHPDQKNTVQRLIESRPAVFVFLLALAFLAHFLYSRGFGLYADDYTYIVPYMFKPLSTVTSKLKETFDLLITANLGRGLGRPFIFLFYGVFGVIGSKIAGLWGVILIGWLIISVNAYLFYRVLSRTVSAEAGFIGAIILILFPAHTLHQWPSFNFAMDASATFLLLATLSYLKGRRVAPYFIITASLLTYESFFLPFFAVPLLLDMKWDRG
ncbi:MAG: hypothetical protein V3T30_08740, partial [Thermodesulfobacteriota bacterium]